MLKRIFFVTSLIMSLLAVACTGSGSGLKSEMQKNRETWEEHNISHYSYQMKISCFCPPEVTEPVSIEVNNGETVSRTYVNNGQPATANAILNVDTIEEVFSRVEDAINNKADKIDVAWDATYGFPIHIFIDSYEDAVDDEAGFELTQFKILQ
jgi:hypothetical protein